MYQRSMMFGAALLLFGLVSSPANAVLHFYHGSFCRPSHDLATTEIYYNQWGVAHLATTEQTVFCPLDRVVTSQHGGWWAKVYDRNSNGVIRVDFCDTDSAGNNLQCAGTQTGVGDSQVPPFTLVGGGMSGLNGHSYMRVKLHAYPGYPVFSSLSLDL